MGFSDTLTDVSGFAALLPEILLVIWGAAVLAADLFAGATIKRKTLGWLAAGGMLFILVLTWFMRPVEGPNNVLGSMVRNDTWTWAFRIIFILGGALTCVASIDFKPAHAAGEYFSLIIFASLGMSLMAASNDIVMLYLATETASIALYLLAGFMRNNKLSAEAGIKYFVFGAVSSTVMLFGLSLMYGMSGGNTGYAQLAQRLAAPELRTGALFATLLVIVGFAFKTSAVPFHFWAPDVYQGAPTPVAGFISTASKAAGFAILVRFLFGVLLSGEVSAAAAAMVSLLRPFAVLTLIVGSLGALVQTNVKRMLAYSSIAQAGYMLMGVAAFAGASSAAGREEALAAVLFYIGTYMITNIGAFSVVGAVSQRLGGDDYANFAGLARRAPYLALAMTAALLSLLGAPPMIGFVGKLFIFRSVMGTYSASGDPFFLWLIVVGVVMVLVSVFYYLAVVKSMYVDRATDDAKPMLVHGATGVVAVVCGLGVIATTLLSGPLFEIAASAARSFMLADTIAQAALR
jgi:NADH-quinone oxidoreductase subunit N